MKRQASSTAPGGGELRRQAAACPQRAGRVPWKYMLWLLFASAGVLAATGSDEPIYLDADHAEIDNVSGISVYTGNVVMTQGLREVTGDRMTVHTVQEGRELSKVYVDGEPAVYTQRPDGEGSIIRAEAPRMEYHATGPERMILLDGGKLTRGRNEFTGEVIEYNLETEVVNARGDETTGRRIRITLFPEEDE